MKFVPQVKDRTEYFRKYYQAHKNHYQKLNDQWWKNHPEKLREKWNRKYWKDPEKSRKEHRAARVKNLEERRRQNRDWQQRRKQYRSSYMHRYYLKNKAKFWLYTHQRRALMKLAAANARCIEAFVKRIKSEAFAYCYYCGKEFPTKGIHFDHIIPLSRGGQHSIENICVACAPCNLRKNSKTISEWLRDGQQILPL